MGYFIRLTKGASGIPNATRSIPEAEKSIRIKMGRQWGPFTALGVKKIPLAVRLKLTKTDTLLNLYGLIDLSYLYLLGLYKNATGQKQTFETMPCEKCREKDGEERSNMDVKTLDGQALNNMRDLMCNITSSGYIFDVNKALKRDLKYEKRDVIGVNIEKLIHQDDYQKVRQHFSSVVSGRQEEPIEVRMKRKDGSYCSMEISTSALTEEGEIMGASILIRDVTERQRRLMEIMINQSVHNMKTLYWFFNHIAKNTLGEKNATAQILMMDLMEMKASLPPEKQVPLQRDIEALQDISGRINKFMRQLSMVQKAEIINKVGYFNVPELIEGAVKELEYNFEANNIRVIFNKEGTDDPGSDGIKVKADESLKLALRYALNNAIEAIEEEVKVRMAEREKTKAEKLKNGQLASEPIKAEPEYLKAINIGINKKEKEVEVAIEDNGIGIEREQLNKIFAPGFSTKLYSSTNNDGMGLTLAQIVMKKMGGKIEVESVSRKMTRVTFTLPLENPKPEGLFPVNPLYPR